MSILALSVRRPWAQLIIGGHKAVENRSWVAAYRARLWVHGGQRWDPEGADLAAHIGLVEFTDPTACPTGYLGTVELVGAHAAAPTRRCCRPWGQAGPGVWHWQMADPRPLAEPVPGSGRLGLYRPPAHLAAAQPELRPSAPARCLDCAANLRVDEATGALVDQWGQATCGASYRAHAPDLPPVDAEPAEPTTSMTDRLRRAAPRAGAGAVPDPPLPHQAGCARSFPDGSAEKRCAGKHLPVRLDPGDPAGPVPSAPRAGAQNTAPARLPSGPANNTSGRAR